MRLLLRFLAFGLIFILTFSVQAGDRFGPRRALLGGVENPPNLFWVVGTGNWSQASHWALTSGGAGGAGTPGVATAVTFDSNSGAAAAVTIDVAARAKSIVLNKSDLTISDNVGMTVSGNITITTGSLLTNGHTENWGSYSSTGTATRVFNITNSTINLTSPSIVVNSIASATGLTATLTGSTVNVTGLSAQFVPGTLVFPNVRMIGGGSPLVGSATYGNLTILGTDSSLLDVAGGINGTNVDLGTLTITGTFTVTGFSQVDRVGLIPGAARTITAAAVALQWVEFRRVTGAGAATWTGTFLGNQGGNSGITFTPAATWYWVGNSGNWTEGAHFATSTGGAGSGNVPMPQDTVNFDVNSFTSPGAVVTLNYNTMCAMDWTGATNNPVLYLFEGGNFSGNVTLAAGMTTRVSATQGVTMTWNNIGPANTLTTNGVVFGAGISLNNTGGSLTLQDDLVQNLSAFTTSGLLLLAGTFNANGHNVTLAGTVNTANGSVTRALTMGTGTWTIKAPSGNIWNAGGTGFTLTATGSTLKISGTPAGNRTFIGGGKTYNNFEWMGEGVASTLILTGANTFADFKVDADTVARTLTMPASTTNASTTIELTGSAGNLLTLNSSTPGTQATISQAIGVVAATFLSLQDSAAVGGAAFTATSSVNVSNNSGWVITP